MKIEDVYNKFVQVVLDNQNSKIHNMARIEFLKVIDDQQGVNSVEFYLKKAIRWDGNFYQLIQVQVDRVNKNFGGECDEIRVTFFCEQDNRVPTKKYIFK